MKREKLPRDPELRANLVENIRWARGHVFAQKPPGERREGLRLINTLHAEMLRDAIAMEERHRQKLFKGLIEILPAAGGVQ